MIKINLEQFDNDSAKLIEKINEQEKTIDRLRKIIDNQNKKIDSLPQLSRTSIGYSTSDNKITFRNWWKVSGKDELNGYFDGMWFTKYIRYNFPDADYKLNFFSVFGKHYNITEEMDGKKIFFTGENINKRFQYFNRNFGSYALKYVDLAMGYDLIDNPKYFRFPAYMRHLFKPFKFDEEIIETTLDKLNNIEFEKSKDVALIASHDKWKTRETIAKDIEKYVHIDFAGRWNNNTNELWDKFNNNKSNFLKQYKFNVCPENLVDHGYVTEKIYHSIQTNCIPLYMGGGNYLEPRILNENKILNWKENVDNSDTVELFKNLISDKKSYDEFYNQDPILPSAKKHVINKFKTFNKHLERLLY